MRGLLDAAEDVVADPRNLEDAVSGVSADREDGGHVWRRAGRC